MAQRAVLFIDGNNWYHGIRRAGVENLSSIDYARLSRRLVGHRSWVGTRYYIGQMPRTWDAELYSEQRRFLSHLSADDSRITIHLGRLETRWTRNEAIVDLQEILARPGARLDEEVRSALLDLVRRHRRTQVLIEKAVDVMLAVDLVVLAERDRYDTAYLLSADGDFTPAVTAARAAGKAVFAVSPAYGGQLAAAATGFIRLDREWFRGCYRE
jgi:uncharacterized LabA/DUF88 family protein